MNIYDVTLQKADGQIVETPYAVRWDSEKVGPEEVARACAAELTCAAGRYTSGEFKMQHAGITAVLRS